MKRKIGRIIQKMCILLILMSLTGNSAGIAEKTQIKAQAVSKASLVATEAYKPFAGLPGDTVIIKVPVKALNQTIDKPILSASCESADLSFGDDFELTRKNYNEPNEIITDIPTEVTFYARIKMGAKAGDYKVSLKAKFIDYSDATEQFESYEAELNIPIIVRVLEQKTDANIQLHNISYLKKVEPGDIVELNFDIRNDGETTAKAVEVAVSGFSSDTVIPDYAVSKRVIGDMPFKKEESVTFPMQIAKTCKTGVLELTIKTVHDGDKTDSTVIYFNVTAPPEKKESKEEADVVITETIQTPKSPMAGSAVKFTFLVHNKSKKPVKYIEITPGNFTAESISPQKSNPTVYISKLEAGEKRRISIGLKVSKNANPGIQNMDLSYSYMDSNFKKFEKTAKVYVLDVQNPKKEKENETKPENESVPKLIIQSFDTGKEPLKAGNVFQFGFDVLNTHAKKSAYNIKISISSPENVFSQTQGSNSIYVASMKPQEKSHHVVELKVKSDCTTKAYPLEISFEYEYDGIVKSEDTKGNEGTVAASPVKETINLSVAENARPVVNNIIVGDYETPVVNSQTSLSFEFYNMGRATLNNVIARLESDGIVAGSNMQFIGNVEAGSGDVYTMDVTPTMEGTVKGNLVITYEDSNGELIEVPTAFESMINGAPILEPDIGDGSIDEGEPETKKELIPLWAFILIQAAVFIIFIIVSRKIVLSLYRRKRMKEEEEDNL